MAQLTWTFEHKKRLCTIKHGEGRKPSKTSYPTCKLVCEGYTNDKQYAAKLGNNAERQATKSLEIVYLGVCGPMKNTFVGEQSILLLLLMIFKEGVLLHDEIQRRVV